MNSLNLRSKHHCIRATLFLFMVVVTAKNDLADDYSIAKQFVNATTIVVAKIDTKRLALPESLIRKFADESVLQRGAKPVVQVLQELIIALNGESVFVAVDVPFSSAQAPVRLFVKNVPSLDAKRLLEQLQRFQFTKPMVQGDYLCLSLLHSTESSSNVVIADNILPATRPDLKIAMQAVQEFPIQVLVLPPDYLWATYRDLMPIIPKQFGGGPISLLTDGVRWSAIGIDPAKLQLQAITQSKSADAATAFASQLPGMLSASSSQLRFPLASIGVEQLIPFVKPIVRGDQITVSIDGLAELDPSFAFITNALAQALGPMQNQLKMDRFKQLGLALLNFESANRVLPPSKDHRDAHGKSALSWRVHLLPYLDQMALYSQFHLKEAWNSEHNLKLLDKMPDVYKGVVSGLDVYSNLKPGHTTFLAPVGDGTIFGGIKPVRISDINDGTVNTLWLVEVKAEFAKPWTAPEDYVFDIANPAFGLAEIASDKPSFLGATVDGSVIKFPLSIPATSLVHLFQMNDGHIVSW